jgi:diguanylate cyclase (GGDEF)-like protein/PAS domain S-box-containing protein
MHNPQIDNIIADRPAPMPRSFRREALGESRQRWRHLVSLAADLAFETDADGRFVFITPETALGWPRGSLIGQSVELLLADESNASAMSAFCPAVQVRRQRTRLRAADGSLVQMAISSTPLRDTGGLRTGWRGIGIDISNADFQEPSMATRLRRGEVLDHILTRINREVSIDGMMDAALSSLADVLSAKGIAVIGSVAPSDALTLLHRWGVGTEDALQAAQNPEDAAASAIIFVPCGSRLAANGVIAIWREPGDDGWIKDDVYTLGAAAGLVRMILEYEAAQHEMAVQARTDPLTELLNRRAFMGELRRHIARLDRENQPGSMIFIDLDGFKAINDELGHAVGDRLLVEVADRLRKIVRTDDLVARLGGDEFALWLSGADHMTAAERADTLCRSAPAELCALLPEPINGVGLSIGIATRLSGSTESIEELIKRADQAMYEVKRNGRGSWRVSDGAAT